MPVNTKYICDFEESTLMHVICKSVGNNVLFKNDLNRIYFLAKYAIYSDGYWDTYSYCLIDNHVHWLIKCMSEDDIKKYLISIPEIDLKIHQKKFLENEIGFSEAIEFQFKDFFISYAMSFNKMNNRSGALFINPFRRVKINDNDHLTQLIIYINANYVKHGGKQKINEYKWSSYQAIISNKATLLKRDEVLNWFGGKERFIKTQFEMTKYFYENSYSME